MAADTTSPIDRAKFEALLNGRYHADREAWLDWLHRIMLLIVIIGGASALVDLFGGEVKVAAGFITVLAGSLDLVFSFTERARKHAFLRKQYFELAASLELPGADVTKTNFEMMRLAADEEPPYCAAHAIAESWAHKAVYGDKGVPRCHVTRSQRLLRHVRRYDFEDFGREGAPPTKA